MRYARIVSPVHGFDHTVSQFLSALFVNKINLAINKSLDGVDAIFQTIREGTLPSASFERFARDHPQLQVLLVDPAGQEYGADHSAKLADEAFMRKR